MSCGIPPSLLRRTNRLDMAILPLIFLSISFILTPALSQGSPSPPLNDTSCLKAIFGGKQMTFSMCTWLDANRKSRLAWSPSKTDPTTFTVFFAGIPEEPYGWAGWGVSTDERGKMLGSDVVVGLANPENTTQVKGEVIHLAGYTSSAWVLGETRGSMQVVPDTLETEYADNGKRVRLLADVKGLTSNPLTGRPPVTVIWRGGPKAEDYLTTMLVQHTDKKDYSKSINFATGFTVDSAAPGQQQPGGSMTGSTVNQTAFEGEIEVNCNVTFQGKTRTHKFCLWLDFDRKFQLAWTPAANGVISFFFKGTPDTPYAWAGWGVSKDEEAQMVGSDVLVGLSDPKAPTKVKVAPYHLAGMMPEDFIVGETRGRMAVVPDTLALEWGEGGTHVLVVADVKGLSEQPMAVVWRGGTDVLDYEKGLLGYHLDVVKQSRIIDFVNGETSGIDTKENSMQKYVHAWLCAIGFGVLLPLGILVARHLRLWADPLWFYMHISFQILGYLLGATGWGFGIWLMQQSEMDYVPDNQKYHMNIGITIFAIATLQIVTPVLKPGKKSTLRFYWNLVHWFLGYPTAILSVANIFLGFWILEYESLLSGPWQIIYIVYVAVWGLAMIVLEPLSWYKHRQLKAQEMIEEEPFKGEP